MIEAIRYLVRPIYKQDYAEGWYFSGTDHSLQIRIGGQWHNVSCEYQWVAPPGNCVADNVPLEKEWNEGRVIMGKIGKPNPAHD